MKTNVVATILGTVISALLTSPTVLGYVNAGTLPYWVPYALQAVVMGLGAWGYHTTAIKKLTGR